MATKLSGTGSDATFIAVIRAVKDAPASTSPGGPGTGVSVYCSSTGIILSAEQRIADVLGMPAAEVVGRPLGSLSADMQALDK